MSGDAVPPLRAGGQPLAPEVAERAADWLTLLMSGEATPEDRARWLHWREAHADHERAWRHIESVTGRLREVPSSVAQGLGGGNRSRRSGATAARRQVLGLFAGGGMAAALGVAGTRTATWQRVTADAGTGVGEQRTLTLPDGTQLTLNTRSALNLSLDGPVRRVHLLTGELLVVTAHAQGLVPDPRPLVVQTAQGDVRPLGTRFVLRQHDAHTEVTVLDDLVRITPAAPGAAPHLLSAGEHATFSRYAVRAEPPQPQAALAWIRGQIIADDMRLDVFLAELARYRPGLVQCDPAVGALRVSGVFPLADTDRILATLPSVLPVQVWRRTRYWITVGPRGTL